MTELLVLKVDAPVTLRMEPLACVISPPEVTTSAFATVEASSCVEFISFRVTLLPVTATDPKLLLEPVRLMS